MGNVNVDILEIVDSCPGDGDFAGGAVVGYAYVVRFQSVVSVVNCFIA